MAWLKKKKQIFAGKLSRPDAEDPEAVNHFNWYMSTGFVVPYPNEKKVRPLSDFKKAAPKVADDDIIYETFPTATGPLPNARGEGFLFPLQTRKSTSDCHDDM